MEADATSYRVFRNGSKTYFNSSLFFPKDVRSDVFTLYAFVRVADDFVDSVPQQADRFYAFRDRYRRAVSGIPAGDDVIDPFVELSRRKNFADTWTESFLYSMELDLQKAVYDSLEETLDYIYGSAEVIGLYMARILGLSDAALHAATRQGRAMQYINFIRDLAEDNERGRSYLPLNDTTLPDLQESTVRKRPEEFKRFLRGQIELYEEWQAQAELGYDAIPKRYRVPVKSAADMYNWTARVIRRSPFIVYRKKVKPSRRRILSAVVENAIRFPIQERVGGAGKGVHQ